MRILIVHPDEEYHSTLKYSFENLGHQADSTGDQVQAMSLFRSQNHEFVFSGHNPPALDALILLKTLKKESQNVKLVISAPQADLNFVCEAIHQRVYDFFLEKVEFRQLLMIVEEIEESRNRREAARTSEAYHDAGAMGNREEQHSRLALEYARLKQAYEDLRASVK
ncbi:MAG: hypothetical protein WA705_17490 [Candidatus Ozemobacteraceae bacterium]